MERVANWFGFMQVGAAANRELIGRFEKKIQDAVEKVWGASEVK